jgi:AcrR family transcriptional regulator
MRNKSKAAREPQPSLAPHLLRGLQTRERVLSLTIQIARQEGLEALTIGRVAEASGLTKPGLLGHYASKEALQLATVDAGAAAFMAAVVEPAMQFPAGIVRLAHLLQLWVDHVDTDEGGCFFASVAAEFDSRRGPVKSGIAKMITAWMQGIEQSLAEAQERNQIKREVERSAVSFELHGYELSLNLRRQLLGDLQAGAHAKAAMRRALHEAATPAGRRLLNDAWPAPGTSGPERRKTQRVHQSARK